MLLRRISLYYTHTLYSADGFINGLAAVAQDVLELTSSGVLLFAVVYDPKVRSSSSSKAKKQTVANRRVASAAIVNDVDSSAHPASEQLRYKAKNAAAQSFNPNNNQITNNNVISTEEITRFTEAWKGGEEALKRRRLQSAFVKKDVDRSGFLERQELSAALSASGVIASAVSATVNTCTINTVCSAVSASTCFCVSVPVLWVQ
jgi:hypothetical protein